MRIKFGPSEQNEKVAAQENTIGEFAIKAKKGQSCNKPTKRANKPKKLNELV